MPDFWNFPTVSMGIGPLNAIYQARFMRYLENRRLIEKTDRKVWAFVGDGETDEVDTLGAIALGAREKLDNLIFVVNCNLQRLDGPVRGNKRIIDELEGVFRGAGWNVIKVIWGSDWDELFARDHRACCSSAWKSASTATSRPSRPRTARTCARSSSASTRSCSNWSRTRPTSSSAGCTAAATIPLKIYNAYKRAIEHKGGPTVILAKTVKGYGLGSPQARNADPQRKEADRRRARRVRQALRHPAARAGREGWRLLPAEPTRPRCSTCRRAAGAGRLPAATRVRSRRAADFKAPALDSFKEWTGGSKGRAVSTTMGFVAILRALMKDPKIGKLIVPIVPDEGRTFGFESAIKQVGIYAPEGQKYTPHDADMLLSYREESRRPDPRRRHHGSRLHGLLHRRRHGLRQLRRALDPLLHVLLHVRLSSASATWPGPSRTRAARAS